MKEMYFLEEGQLVEVTEPVASETDRPAGGWERIAWSVEPEQPTYQLGYEICPALERCHFVRICKRLALRLAASALPQEDGLALPL